MLINIRSVITKISGGVFRKPTQPAKIDNILTLIDEAKTNQLYYERLDLQDYNKCDFISCKNQAVLFLEGFNVCENHGFRYIKRLTDKTKNDNVVTENK